MFVYRIQNARTFVDLKRKMKVLNRRGSEISSYFKNRNGEYVIVLKVEV
jgi:ribosomal protein L17